MLIKESTQLADAIHDNYLLLSILNRFGIHLGFGNKTVEQICKELDVNKQFFLEIVNSFSDPEYFPESELKSFPLQLIIEYIGKSHDYYIKNKFPKIELMIQNLLDDAPEQHKNQYRLIAKFYKEYKDEFIVQIDVEDKNVHPYILKINEAYQQDKLTDEIIDLVKKETINKYADHHDNLEDKLFDLKNLIIKYLPPSEDYSLSNSILYELFRLERDLNDHSRIEDKVLVPKVQLLEKQILEKAK